MRTPGYVDLLDAADLRPIRRIELPRRAFALAMDHKRGRLIVGNTLDGSLSVLDARSGVLLEVIQLGKPEGDGFEHTRMIEIDGESGRVFVSSPSEAGTLWIVDTAAGNAVTRIDDAGLWAAGLAHDPASGRVYVSGGGMNEILIVDGRSGARIGTLSTGDTTEPGQDASKHFFINLALDAKGERLFAADANSGQLYVFDIASGKAVKTVPIGLGVLDVTYVAQSDQIFVTYRGVDREHPEGSGGLVVLDGSDYAPQVSIPLPVHPNSLSVGDEGKTLFVTVKAPMEKEHPAYREGAADSVLRIDLAALNAAIR
ncbi:YncE family protein [Paracoccus yeei]|uniref:YncE family protein n=1 Tax=Paracoccus yeei TaxID=147645 RepID=UPI003BF8519A